MPRKSKVELELEKTGYSPRRQNKHDIESLDDLPDIGVDYDEVYLLGTIDEIAELEESFVVDMSDPLELETLNDLIEDPPITWCDPVKGFDVSLSRGKIKKSARKKFVDFYGINITIATLANNVLKGDYEIRVFREWMLDDSWVQILKPTHWWKPMDRNFGKRMDDLFVRMDDWNDLNQRLSKR